MLYLRKLPQHDVLQNMAERIPEAEPLSIESCLLLLRVAGDMRTLLDESLAAGGTSHGRFTILMLLYRHREDAAGVLPSELAEWAGVSRATVTGLLSGLESLGLIERVRDPQARDRRLFSARLTASGIAFIEKTLPGHTRLVALMLAPLSDREKKQLAGLLGKIDGGLGAARESLPAKPRTGKRSS